MAKPVKPTGVKWIRKDNNSMTLSWNAVAGATSYGVRWRKGSQAGFDSATQIVKGITGLSFTFEKMSVNSGYQFVVYALNSEGEGPNSDPTTWFYTEPSRPLFCKATATFQTVEPYAPVGVCVGFTMLSYYQSGVEIQRENPDGSFTSGTLGNGTSGKVAAPFYDDEVGGLVRYRARAFVGATSPAGSRVFSVWSPWSDYVELAYRAPFAPRLSLSRVGQNREEPVTPDYRSRDGSAQTGARIQWRKQGSTAWNTVTGVKTVAFPAQSELGVYEIQGAVKGAGPDWSEWSVTRTVEVIKLPTGTLITPEASWGSNRLLVSWSTSQADGEPQYNATIEIYSATSQLLAEKRIIGGATQWLFEDLDLANGQVITVKARVSVGGVWVTFERTVTVLYTPPASPLLDVEWDEVGGRHYVSVTPGTGSPVATVDLKIERSLDGDTYTPVEMFDSTPLPDGFEFLDAQGRSNGSTWYRATAIGANTATAKTVVECVSHSPKVWVDSGSPEEAGVGFPYGISVDSGRSKQFTDLVWLDGDDVPSIISPSKAKIMRTLRVRASLMPPFLPLDEYGTTSITDREYLAYLFETHDVLRVRTPEGDSVIGLIQDLDFTNGRLGGSVTFTVTEAQ